MVTKHEEDALARAETTSKYSMISQLMFHTNNVHCPFHLRLVKVILRRSVWR